jgi:hypothetical protein
MRLGAELWASMDARDEQEFTLRTVLPILRKLGFPNVRYSHLIGRRLNLLNLFLDIFCKTGVTIKLIKYLDRGRRDPRRN